MKVSALEFWAEARRRAYQSQLQQVVKLDNCDSVHVEVVAMILSSVFLKEHLNYH
jgi:hypothetical protein